MPEWHGTIEAVPRPLRTWYFMEVRCYSCPHGLLLVHPGIILGRKTTPRILYMALRHHSTRDCHVTKVVGSTPRGKVGVNACDGPMSRAMHASGVSYNRYNVHLHSG